MKNQLDLIASIAEIKRTQKDHENSELISCKRTYNEGAPAATKKYIALQNDK